MRSAIAISLLTVSFACGNPLKEELPAGLIARLGTASAPPKDEVRPGDVNALLFVDNSTLLAGTNSGWTSWDLRTKQTRQAKPVGGPTFALARDAERLWIGTAKKLHAVESPQSASLDPARSWDSHSERVSVVAISPSNTRLVYSNGEQKLALLDTRTGKTSGEPEFISRPVAASLASHGRVLVVVTRDGAARQYNLSADGKLEPIWAKRVARAEHVAAGFSPDGRVYAVASAGRIMILESTTGRQMLGLERRFGEGDVRCLAISPDGRMIAAGSRAPEPVVRVWNLANGQELASFKGHLGDVQAIVFSPDGKSLASAGSDQCTMVWKVPLVASTSKSIPLQEAWNSFDSLEAVEAYALLGSYLADAAAAVKSLREAFQDSEGEHKRILRWIAELDHDEFRIRESARRSLTKTGLRGAAYLNDPKRMPLGAEGEQRVRQILEAFELQGLRAPEGGLYGEQLRSVRAVRILETIGTKEAKAALEFAAKGPTASRLTREAKGALEAWPEAK